MRNMIITVLAALAFANSGPSALFAATVFTEDFSSLAPGAYGAGAMVGGFLVTSGTVDVLSVGFFDALCTGAAVVPCVDLDGSSAGTLSTSSLMLPVGSYTLTFVLNGSQRGAITSTTVGVGSLYSETFNLASQEMNTFVRNFSVILPTLSTLTFTSNTPGVAGAILDNVTMSSEDVIIPEPSSMLLSLAGVATFIVGHRKLTR